MSDVRVERTWKEWVGKKTSNLVQKSLGHACPTQYVSDITSRDRQYHVFTTPFKRL